jgi:hypothetical protein
MIQQFIRWPSFQFFQFSHLNQKLVKPASLVFLGKHFLIPFQKFNISMRENLFSLMFRIGGPVVINSILDDMSEVTNESLYWPSGCVA